MSNPAGSFIWYELVTTDPDAAAAFYGHVVGWEANGAGIPEMDYRLFSIGDAQIGGLMPLPPEAAASGMTPTWLGYIGVEDVDAAVDGVTVAGGAVIEPAMDIPGVGRFAMVADPQGAIFHLMRGDSDGESRSFSPGTTGHGGWHELHTTDWEAAFAFYSARFGWAKSDALDMGPMGTYLLFNGGSGDPIGGMMTNPDFPRPTWLYYFNVHDIDTAASRVTEKGGTILHGPAEVPGGDFIIQATDPQGAMFALAGRRES